MPPKNKGSSKKPAKARTPTLIDGLTKEELSKEQMEEHIARLREELDREREERNYFQLERDQVHTFWKITERQLEEVKAQLKNSVKDMEENEGRHQVEIKVYKQKMKHLLCEHQNTISELKADGLVSAQMMQKEQKHLETELHKDMEAITTRMQELGNENLVKELELKHEEEMTKMRNSLEKQIAEIEAKYEKKMELLPLELDNIRKNETSKREDHWNKHISSLMEDHQKAFREAEALICHMHQDLDTNSSFKTETKEINMKREEKEKHLDSLLQSNKLLAERLSTVKEESAKKEKKLKNYSSKEDVNKRIMTKELDDLKLENETLKQSFKKLQLERDTLYETFSQSVEKVQHEADLSGSLLEQKLSGLTDDLEKTQAQLLSVLSASNMDQTSLDGIMKTFQRNLDSTNDSIKNLQYKKNKISKARKDLLLAYEAKQRAVGVPVEEL